MEWCQFPENFNILMNTQLFTSFPDSCIFKGSIMLFPGSTRETDLTAVRAIIFIALNEDQVYLFTGWIEECHNRSPGWFILMLKVSPETGCHDQMSLFPGQPVL